MQPKVYLETTVFNWYFEHDRQESEIVFDLFTAILDGRVFAYTSIFALEELNAAHEPKRSNMLALARRPEIVELGSSDEVQLLAGACVSNGLIPTRYLYDAAHAAVAAVNGIDYIVTYNMKHLNNDRARKSINDIVRNMGYREVHICTAKEVLDYVSRGS